MGGKRGEEKIGEKGEEGEERKREEERKK